MQLCRIHVQGTVSTSGKTISGGVDVIMRGSGIVASFDSIKQ